MPLPTTGPKRIRALDRGLRILAHLSENGRSSLADLRAASQLSNATLLRLLATLQDRNWVRRNIVEGQYELSYSLEKVLNPNARTHPLAEIAAPILLELIDQQFGWPSDLVVPIGDGKIELIESTRQRGPLAPNRTGLGIRPSMIFSAHGRVTLAFGTQKEVDAHLRAILKTGAKEELLWIEDGHLDRVLRTTIKVGFALREPYYWADPFDYAPEFGAIAVPILFAGRLLGSLSLVWLPEKQSLDEILAAGCVERLKKAARNIGEAAAEAAIADRYGRPGEFR